MAAAIARSAALVRHRRPFAALIGDERGAQARAQVVTDYFRAGSSRPDAGYGPCMPGPQADVEILSPSCRGSLQPPLGELDEDLSRQRSLWSYGLGTHSGHRVSLLGTDPRNRFATSSNEYPEGVAVVEPSIDNTGTRAVSP